MSEVNRSDLSAANATDNYFLEINTSTSLIVSKIVFAYLSLFSGYILLYICYERVLCISHDFLDMLFCSILCDMFTATGIINNCVYYFGIPDIDITNSCDAAIYCTAPSFYSSYFNVAGQLWTLSIEVCCFFVMARNSITFYLPKAVKIILHVTFWTIPGEF